MNDVRCRIDNLSVIPHKFYINGTLISEISYAAASVETHFSEENTKDVFQNTAKYIYEQWRDPPRGEDILDIDHPRNDENFPCLRCLAPYNVEIISVSGENITYNILPHLFGMYSNCDKDHSDD